MELDGKVKKMTLEGWKAHLRNDHRPYYRGCKTCLETCGQARHHRKVVMQDSYTLAVGPGWSIQTRRWPAWPWKISIGRSLHRSNCHGWTSIASPIQGRCEKSQEGDEQKKEEAVDEGQDPLEEVEDPTAEFPPDVKDDDRSRWQELIQAQGASRWCSWLYVRSASKPTGAGSHFWLVKDACQTSLHGPALDEIALRQGWRAEIKGHQKVGRRSEGSEDLHDGDAFKSNGKVQAEVGMLKEQIRTLLKESGEEAQLGL